MKSPIAVAVDIEVTAPSWHNLGRNLRPLARKAVVAALEAARGNEATARHPIFHQADGNEISVAILFAGQRRLRTLNRQFRQYDKTTDVLAFPSSSLSSSSPSKHESETAYLGDIALGWEPCLASARAFGVSPSAQTSHLIVHGVLHLLALNHEHPSETRTMRHIEATALATLGLKNPWQTHKNQPKTTKNPENRAKRTSIQAVRRPSPVLYSKQIGISGGT